MARLTSTTNDNTQCTAYRCLRFVSSAGTVCWFHLSCGRVLGVHDQMVLEYDSSTLAPLGLVVAKVRPGPARHAPWKRRRDGRCVDDACSRPTCTDPFHIAG